MKKENEFLSKILQKTSDTSKTAIEEMQKGVAKMSEKIKEDSYSRKLKKYNPLFPEQFFDKSNFNIPNVIIIVDDAIRRGIDVCEGAIGWLQTQNNTEILYLYDEFINDSGIQFIPAPVCDAVYYVDCYNKNNFINVDHIFNKSHEERIAELKHIAYSLGAKSCSIQIVEKSVEHKSRKLNSKTCTPLPNAASASEEVEQSISSDNSEVRNGKVLAKFKGNKNPTVPVLKWFQHDNNIKQLIEIRCSKPNSIKTEKLEFFVSSFATMSQKTAAALTSAVPALKVSSSINLESQLKKELSTKLIFELMF